MDLLKKLVQFIKESRTEMKKVSWPSQQETLRYTLIIIGISLSFALFLGFIDIGLRILLQKFIIQ